MSEGTPPGDVIPPALQRACRPARVHAVGPVLGPHARTDRGRDTRVAEPRLPAPEDGRPGEGQRLTPDAPHNGGRHPPRERPSANPTASNAGPQGPARWGQCWVPTPAATAPETRGLRPWPPAPEDGRHGEGQRLTPDAPHNGGRPPPQRTARTTPTARSPHRACEPGGP